MVVRIAFGILYYVLVTTSFSACSESQANAQEEPLTRFSITADWLPDALDRFSEQSGLQVIYEHSVAYAKKSPSIIGQFKTSEVLQRLLKDTGLEWTYANNMTVVIRKLGTESRAEELASSGMQQKNEQIPTLLNSNNIVSFGDIKVTTDPQRILPNEASSTLFGFKKTLLETPRSASFISAESIELFGLSAVEDLVRVVPGTFTTTRFGIQGGVDIRNVPADTYFRGMKRLSLQGNGRSVLAATDMIEIVRGPPSPIYGMGKIGGYTNVVPKSGRATNGGYLLGSQGFAQIIGGSYERKEASFGIGGPVSILDKQGGYYIYGLIEDSNSFSKGVPIKQKVLQAALTIDNFLSALRLETGVNYQQSRTAGALTGRLTQALIDRNQYIRGSPLVDLDLNGNGAIGYMELQRGSPVQGNLTATNQPLIQAWSWPKDTIGNPLPLDQFAVTPGIPASMYDYLIANPQADPTGLLRAQGIGGPQPISGLVPLGMMLDPRSMSFDRLDLRRATAFERDLRAEFVIGYIDLIYDANPGYSFKNQLFFDGMRQYKTSDQPFSQTQKVYVLEDKLTFTKRFMTTSNWLTINSLASLNIRNTVSDGKFFLNGDFSTHRTDAMAATWNEKVAGLTANTTFANSNDNADINSDGFPWTADYRTEFSEFGLGVLMDIDVFRKTNVLVGGRIDISEAENVDYAGIFNANTGTSENPGAFTMADAKAHAWDQGVSWSLSVSQQLPYNLRPYVTLAKSSVTLDSNSNALTNVVINRGHLGAAKLKEAGIKTSLFDDTLFISVAAYEQYRSNIDANDDTALINSYASSTITQGREMEIKWVPIRNLFLSFYLLNQATKYDPNISSTVLVDARTLGFKDVLDLHGNIIYPAEAFLYGGRSRLMVPANLSAYEKKQGNPETQLGLNGTYQFKNSMGITWSGNYFSKTCSGRLCVVTLPEATVLNAGLYFNVGRWRFKFDAFNITDEHYFRARTGDTLGDPLAQVMPDRHWQITLHATF